MFICILYSLLNQKSRIVSNYQQLKKNRLFVPFLTLTTPAVDHSFYCLA